MNNKIKIFIKLIDMDLEYELSIPINKKVGTIKKYIVKALIELTKGEFAKTENDITIIDKFSGHEYINNLYVKDSEIKNGSTLLIV